MTGSKIHASLRRSLRSDRILPRQVHGYARHPTRSQLIPHLRHQACQTLQAKRRRKIPLALPRSTRTRGRRWRARIPRRQDHRPQENRRLKYQIPRTLVRLRPRRRPLDLGTRTRRQRSPGRLPHDAYCTLNFFPFPCLRHAFSHWVF
jgi:hypothetical protein